MSAQHPFDEMLRAQVEAILRDLGASNTNRADLPPEWVRIESEAARRGFGSTRAFRAWCLKRGVAIREDSPRVAWVRVPDVDAAVQGLPLVTKAAPKPPRPSKPAPRQEQQELAPPPAPPPVFRLWEGAQPGDLTQQAREPRGMFAHVIGRVDGVLRPLCFHAEQRPEPWHPAEDREEICPLCARDAKRAKIRVRPPLKHSPTLPDRLVVQPLKTVCAADLLGGTDAPAKS